MPIRDLLEKKCVQRAYEELSKGVNSLEQLYYLGDVYLRMGFFSKWEPRGESSAGRDTSSSTSRERST